MQKFPEYGELYEGLCTATGEIPFAIYRTERVDNETGSPATKPGSMVSDIKIIGRIGELASQEDLPTDVSSKRQFQF